MPLTISTNNASLTYSSMDESCSDKQIKLKKNISILKLKLSRVERDLSEFKKKLSTLQKKMPMYHHCLLLVYGAHKLNSPTKITPVFITKSSAYSASTVRVCERKMLAIGVVNNPCLEDSRKIAGVFE